VGPAGIKSEGDICLTIAQSWRIKRKGEPAQRWRITV